MPFIRCQIAPVRRANRTAKRGWVTLLLHRESRHGSYLKSFETAPQPNPGSEAATAAVLESDGRRLGKLCSWEIIEHSFRRLVGGVDSGCRNADERWWVLEGDD